MDFVVFRYVRKSEFPLDFSYNFSISNFNINCAVFFFFWLQGKSTYDSIYPGICCDSRLCLKTGNK